MAGTDSRFDSAAFRTAIKNAMTMGLPDTTNERVTFRWTTERTFSNADSGDNPFEWNATPASEEAIADLQLTCALEFFSKGGDSQGTRVGEFDVSRVIVTMLDEEWAQLLSHSDNRVPDKLFIADAEYKTLFVGPPQGLFDVTVYQLYAQALDEV